MKILEDLRADAKRGMDDARDTIEACDEELERIQSAREHARGEMERFAQRISHLNIIEVHWFAARRGDDEAASRVHTAASALGLPCKTAHVMGADGLRRMTCVVVDPDEVDVMGRQGAVYVCEEA